jgi:lipid II:glycine glycyltransferase (peptidoglycan interpeptide bridge formation enzyme)
MQNIKTLLSSDAGRWDDFVQSHEMATIYHTSAWRKIIEKTYRHKAVYFYLENPDGKITAGMPFFTIKNRLTGSRLTSLPGAQACNPLISSQDEYNAFIEHALTVAKAQNIGAIELKTSERFPLDSTQYGRGQNGYSIYVLDLNKDITDIENALHKSTIRRAIKKASANNLELMSGRSVEDVRIFYKLYLKMRKQYGLLPQPYKFFATMSEVLPSENIEILHAKYQGQDISSILLLKYNDTVTYEYGASLFEMKKLGASPFLLWEAIKGAHQNGYAKFDFGRVADDNAGLVQFKKRWGAKREALTYYYIPDLGGSAQIRQQGFSKGLMSYSVQRLPETVCQMAGSVLYRNFV